MAFISEMIKSMFPVFWKLQFSVWYIVTQDANSWKKCLAVDLNKVKCTVKMYHKLDSADSRLQSTLTETFISIWKIYINSLNTLLLFDNYWFGEICILNTLFRFDEYYNVWG